MTLQYATDGINRYFQELLALQKRVIETQHDVLRTVAKEMADVVIKGGRIYVFGTGHSHLLAEEAFYRAGGLATIVPIFMSNLMLHENAELASRLERTQGIAGILLDQYDHHKGDMIFIVSNSGVNQMPVEMALDAKERNLTVVSLCSIKYSRIAPLSPIGKRLEEVSDYTIDNCGMPGDALVGIKGTPWRVGPTSTIIGALIWNCLLTETIDYLLLSKEELPIFASFNMEGAAAHNEDILKNWSIRNPHIRNRV
jgi:uncharacterized phosphosugar-binding protein